MKKIRLSVSILVIAILLIPASIFAESNNNLLVNCKLSSIDATGEFEGYKIIKGYPEEQTYTIYLKDDDPYNSMFIKLINPKINTEEIYSFIDNNILYEDTIENFYDLFEYCFETTIDKGASNEQFSKKWFKDKFGAVYTDWLNARFDALNVVEKYLQDKKQEDENKINAKGSLDSLKQQVEKPDPDMFLYYNQISRWVKDENGDLKYKMYDSEGNYITTLSNRDDTQYTLAEIMKIELPPSLSDGYISKELLGKLYAIYVKIDKEKDNIKFEKGSQMAPEELLTLKFPKGWFDNFKKDIKIDGVQIKKYMYSESFSKEKEWIDYHDFLSYHGILDFCEDGYDVIFYKYEKPGQRNNPKKLIKVKYNRLKFKKQGDYEVATVNGLRIKKEDNYYEFNLADLRKLNILPIKSDDIKTVLYFNIDDLESKGIIKF